MMIRKQENNNDRKPTCNRESRGTEVSMTSKEYTPIMISKESKPTMTSKESKFSGRKRFQKGKRNEIEHHSNIMSGTLPLSTKRKMHDQCLMLLMWY